MRWYPLQEEIQYLLTAKEHEFAQQETQGIVRVTLHTPRIYFS
jgi:hypothetical protein